MDFGNYPTDSQQQAMGGYVGEGGLAKMARMPTLKERLSLAVVKAEANLAAAKEARDIFERNPDLERLLDLMQNNHF